MENSTETAFHDTVIDIINQTQEMINDNVITNEDIHFFLRCHSRPGVPFIYKERVYFKEQLKDTHRYCLNTLRLIAKEMGFSTFKELDEIIAKKIPKQALVHFTSIEDFISFKQTSMYDIDYTLRDLIFSTIKEEQDKRNGSILKPCAASVAYAKFCYEQMRAICVDLNIFKNIKKGNNEILKCLERNLLEGNISMDKILNLLTYSKYKYDNVNPILTTELVRGIGLITISIFHDEKSKTYQLEYKSDVGEFAYVSTDNVKSLKEALTKYKNVALVNAFQKTMET